MADPHWILCGENACARRLPRSAKTLRLVIGQGQRQVKLDLYEIVERMSATLTGRAGDLLEIAAYVYAADLAIRRGKPNVFEYGVQFQRDLRFVITVRHPQFWNQPAVMEALVSVLSFLTGDQYQFQFQAHSAPHSWQQHLTNLRSHEGQPFEEVLLFSGGLDSLAGAVQQSLRNRHRVLLVSHYASNVVRGRQTRLLNELNQRIPDPDRQLRGIGLRVTGAGAARESTQRSRSFLFATLAAVAAESVGLNRFSFAENGITSMNLPVSWQILGCHASRTTHPQVLAGFAQLFTHIFEHEFAVINHFVWRTKAQILRELSQSGHADLCALTVSCAHTRTSTPAQPHCGQCSQCVDRRFSVLAAGLTGAHDPPTGYRSDVILGPRDEQGQIYAERCRALVYQIPRLTTPMELLTEFTELTHILPHLGLPNERALMNLWQLFQDYSQEVREVLENQVRQNTTAVVGREYAETSLLAVATGRVQPTPLVPTDRTSPGNHWEVDPQRFTVRWGSKELKLKDTIVFRLCCYLANNPRSVSVTELIQQVWQNTYTSNNTVQRAISTLRHSLRKHFSQQFLIENQRQTYQLVIPAPSPPENS